MSQFEAFYFLNGPRNEIIEAEGRIAVTRMLADRGATEILVRPAADDAPAPIVVLGGLERAAMARLADLEEIDPRLTAGEYFAAKDRVMARWESATKSGPVEVDAIVPQARTVYRRFHTRLSYKVNGKRASRGQALAALGAV